MSSEDLEGIPARLAEVKRRIEAAATRAGRAPESVRLVAVSKNKPAEAIRAAYAAGQRDFGENYMQELTQKAEALADLKDLQWHVIGPIQRNKAKLVARVASFVHAIDRVELVTALDKQTEFAAPFLSALVEVNVSGEATKHGVSPDGLGAVLEALGRSTHLRGVGLMTMAPFVDDPELARPTFKALRELRDRHGGAAALPHLSMGMSHDFEVAIEEGATLVRVGTAIFGARG